MLAMRLTSLLRGFVYAYCFRVKLVGTERVELSLIQGMSLCNTNIACVPIEMVAEVGNDPNVFLTKLGLMRPSTLTSSLFRD